jgi:putative transposase
MSRPLRIERAGGWYHVTARGNERRDIYRDNRDRQHYCELLGEMVARFRVKSHAFVLMDNHYHLLLELTEANLSRAVQWLNASYSVWFNRRHGRSGHLFQGRFKSVVVDPLSWGLELSRYVHLNPVRVGRLGLAKADRQQMRVGACAAPRANVVSERLSCLRRYRWSSYRAYVGLSKKPDWLELETVLRLGGSGARKTAPSYREYVEAAVREGLEKCPWEELKEQVVLGGAAFLEKLKAHIRGDGREQGAARRLAAARPSIGQVIGAVEKLKGESWTEFRDRHGDEGRDLALYLGRRACGMKLRELAETAGLKDYSAAALAIKRFERRLQRNRNGEKEQLKRLRQMSNVEM